MLKMIQQIVEYQIAPALAEHGGGIELVEFTEDGVLKIRLLGQCCNCPASQATVNELILSTLQERLPMIEAIEIVESSAAKELMSLARDILQGK